MQFRPTLALALLALLLEGCAHAAPGDAAAAPPVVAASLKKKTPGGGAEVRAITDRGACPSLTVDAAKAPMTLRAPASNDFPALCSARLPDGAKAASIEGVAVPMPVADPQRILVLGDTGCRIKGTYLQACNDPRAWPFPGLAKAAAALKPDLVLHVGDYLYRESPCPEGNAGCAGSPYGDNWPSWNADFFAPAAPLLAAAP